MSTPINIPADYQKEFAEFLRHKREEVKKELDKLDDMIGKLISNQNGHPVAANPATNGLNGHSTKVNGANTGSRGSVGWKHKIDKVLRAADSPLTFGEVIEGLIANEPSLGDDFPRSSLGSALASNSVPPHNRYIKEKGEGGVTYYSWNLKFVE